MSLPRDALSGWHGALAPYRLGAANAWATLAFVLAFGLAYRVGISPWGLRLVLAFWLAYSVAGAVLSAGRRHAERLARSGGLSLALVTAALLASGMGAALGFAAVDRLAGSFISLAPRQLLAPLAFALCLHGLPMLGRWREARRQQARVARQAQQAVLADLSRQVAQSELKALQAQVEPHFLYNTLAGIQYLVRHNPALADEMLGRLHSYLRLALPSMRAPLSSLSHELELAQHYLALAQMRLGARLQVDLIRPEAELCAQPLAPLMLGTLIENALKHGIEPRERGGTISLRAWRDGESAWVLSVEDDGQGLAGGPAATAGSGLGLHNLRERLALLHGPDAALTVAQRPGGGVRAQLRLPWVMPAAV